MKLYLHKFAPRIFLMALLLAQLSFTAGTALPQGNWTKLADRTVNYTIDHTEINIDGIRQNLGAIRVKVARGAINLHRCVVYYQDSQTQDIAVLNSIPEGGESKVIELAHNQPVTRVVLVYDTKNRAIQKADVELWGRR
jgi:hypothetical protein